ncbi:MAG: helix-turn-helix transcriptional regulator [Rickettsiales bacterium]|nr:helix-turn-helix transcriptional regulator [Rickettsiales bacterium]
MVKNLFMLTDGELGKKLRILLEVKGINRGELAKKLNKIPTEERTKNEITESILQSYEAGRRNFSAVFLINLCKVLKVDIRYFSEDLGFLLENEDKIKNIFDIKRNSVINVKLNRLIKILDKITDESVAKKLICKLDDLK